MTAALRFAQYVDDTGQDPSDPTTVHAFEQEERLARRGRHAITCSGYNERPCDCGMVDAIEADRDDLRDSLQRCNADLIAALARYQEMARKHNALSHEVERLREGQSVEARPVVHVRCQAIVDRPYGLTCGRLLELSPLHDTDVPVLVRLAGWGVNEKGERLCPKCK